MTGFAAATSFKTVDVQLIQLRLSSILVVMEIQNKGYVKG